MTKQILDRRVQINSVPNFRDLGGLPVDGGVFTAGQVFRSSTLSALSAADLPHFEQLGVHTVFDLRTSAENEAHPDRLPETVRVVGLDVLAHGTGIAQSFGKLQADPSAVNEMLMDGKAQKLLETSYREFIDLPSAQSSYREFFMSLVDESRTGAALFHCTAGKDRTGWAAVSLLKILGASEETYRADYLQTNEDYLPAIEPMLKKAASTGLDESALRALMGVNNGYLDAALDQLEMSYGTIENYFTKGLGLETGVIDALRARFVA